MIFKCLAPTAAIGYFAVCRPRKPGSNPQRLLRIEGEAPLKDQKIALLEQRVSNLEKENDLLKQQNTIQEKLTVLAKREAEVYRTAFEKEKELTDRALKLAEMGKPKSNWELQGLPGWFFSRRIFGKKIRVWAFINIYSISLGWITEAMFLPDGYR